MNNQNLIVTVIGTKHDKGAEDLTLRRPIAEAEWTANLMRQCGYTTVTVK